MTLSNQRFAKLSWGPTGHVPPLSAPLTFPPHCGGIFYSAVAEERFTDDIFLRRGSAPAICELLPGVQCSLKRAAARASRNFYTVLIPYIFININPPYCFSGMPFACRHRCKTERLSVWIQKVLSRQNRYVLNNASVFFLRFASAPRYFCNQINDNTCGNCKWCKTPCRRFRISFSKHDSQHCSRTNTLIFPVRHIPVPLHFRVYFPALQIILPFGQGYFDPDLLGILSVTLLLPLST